VEERRRHTRRQRRVDAVRREAPLPQGEGAAHVDRSQLDQRVRPLVRQLPLCRLEARARLRQLRLAQQLLSPPCLALHHAVVRPLVDPPQRQQDLPP